MSEIPLDPDGQVPQKGTGGGGIVIPDAIATLVADMDLLKARVTDLEARV